MLDCIAICRCMDKKPYDNTTNDFSLTTLATKGLASDVLRGGLIMKSDAQLNRPANTFTGMKNAGSIESSGFTATSSISDRMSEVENASPAFSAVMAVGRKKGKRFAPLPGNRHRTTGLIQRNSVVQERTTLSQAGRAASFLSGRCNA